MTVDKKKLAVISAAISAYMATEQVFEAKPVMPMPAASAWRSSGIGEMMELRRMVQLRFLRSSR